MDNTTLEKLHYNQLKDMVKGYCASGLGKSMIDKLQPSTNINVTILFNKEFVEVNYRRLKLEIKASELYPEGYDLNQLFVGFKERKLERDIERGSKKALKEVKKGHLK